MNTKQFAINSYSVALLMLVNSLKLHDDDKGLCTSDSIKHSLLIETMRICAAEGTSQTTTPVRRIPLANVQHRPDYVTIDMTKVTR
jgi:hypothetical protein